MASSFYSNAQHVDFESVLSMDDHEMVSMFEALMASDLRGFLGCPAVVYEDALIDFFENASVRNGVLISTVGGQLVEISEELFAESFELPVDAISVKAGSFNAITVEKFSLITAVVCRIKMNWAKFLFSILKRMVTPRSKQAKGFAIQISLLLATFPSLELGESSEFPASKVLTMKTVHHFVSINDRDGAEQVTGAVKQKAVSKKRPAADVGATVPKRKRTIKKKSISSISTMELVAVAEEALPIQQVAEPLDVEEPRCSSADAVDLIIQQVLDETRAADAPADTAQPAVSEEKHWFDLPYDDLVARWEAERPVVTASDTDEDVATVDVAPADGDQQVQEFVAPISAEVMLSTDEQMSLDDILLTIPVDIPLPSSCMEVTKITMGKSVKIPGVTKWTWFLQSLPRIPVNDKGKQILVEKDPVKGNPAKEHYSLICADIELLVSLRAQIIDEVAKFFHSFSLRKLASINLEDMYKKEEQVLHWGETESPQVAIQRKFYILLKYRTVLVWKFLEAWRVNFVPGQGSSAVDIQVIELLSDLYLSFLEELAKEARAHNLIWNKPCCSKIFEGSPRDRGTVIARTNSNTRSSCWIRTMILVNGLWTVELCADKWTGIKCTSHNNRVAAIDLSSQGLVGSLTPHIGNLSYLINIDLQNNSFNGRIPQEIGLLWRLRRLEFSNNSFVGPIPTNLSQCRNLYYLNLLGNKLSGTIPPELGSMYKLEALGLSENTLSGPIPPSFGNLTSLRVLSIDTCGLGGEIPETLTKLRKLTFFQVSVNNFAGTIPAGLFNISSMSYFDVSENQLHGTIPTTIGLTLPNLQNLILVNHDFTGVVPVSISNISSLVQIATAYNYFTGRMPDLGGLSLLRRVHFSVNKIQDDTSFISSFTNCTNLEILDVGQNLIRGPLPDSVANLSRQLNKLSLFSNQIYGNIPSGIGNLAGLSVLYLHDNILDGPIPSSIGKLLYLQRLFLAANRFSDELPFSLGNLTLLNLVVLGENNISGRVPSSIGNCANLQILDLSRNNLHGLIPPEILGLSSISIALDLSHNVFSGSIPFEVGFLTNLGLLDLSNNRLSGNITKSIRRCISLEKLYLQGNLLEGEIPSELSALMGLQALDLSQNKLSGPIPSSIAKLSLQELNLSFNLLRGEVPMTGIFINSTAVSLEGNNGLCGGVPELKLPPCVSSSSSSKNSPNLVKVLIPTLVGGVICIVLLSVLIYNCRRRMSNKNDQSSSLSMIGPNFLRLSYENLQKATNGFSETNLIGAGRFGSVYKGSLNDGVTVVAVKVLKLSVKGASKSFEAECKVLSGVRHRNLLKILSVCDSVDSSGNDFKALVYEFKANGSLEKLLYHAREEGEYDEEFMNLTLIQRLKISIDIAHALEYLHTGADTTIIHGDLKPSNILLDHDMTAYIADFGLAKMVADLVSADESSSSFGIKGTIGYVAPEYSTNNVISTQGDMYSYGILLLEIFTNRRPTDEAFKDHLDLHSFVSNTSPDDVMKIVDPLMRVASYKGKDCIASVLKIGVACSRTIPRDRMPIADVVNELCKIRNYFVTFGGYM
ncbi:receptor-like protein kinase [Dorcoceras hygrometricum]|uniref:non-specific serine/threonine protein kinase n=1 Tax=Dorcoceras hygrometricum TaxID=472368 RepID=A0A2Z7B2W0_9LAMI|nr:receptor-like protein kinase [Dorcoceras hygrometricum]